MCKLGAHLLKCCTPCQSSNPPLHPCPLAPPFPLPPPELPQRCPATLPGSHFSLLSAGMLPLSSSCLGLCPGLWGSLPGWQWGLHRGLCRGSPHFSLLLPPHSDCRHHEPLASFEVSDCANSAEQICLKYGSYLPCGCVTCCTTYLPDSVCFIRQDFLAALCFRKVGSEQTCLIVPISFVEACGSSEPEIGETERLCRPVRALGRRGLARMRKGTGCAS